MSLAGRSHRLLRSNKKIAAVWCLALAVFASACDGRDSALQAHLEKTQQLVSEGRPEEALVELEKAIELAPDDANLHLHAARLLMQTDRELRATTHMIAAFDRDPSQTAAALQAAKLLLDRDPGRATKICDRVLENSPDIARAHFLRATALASLGRLNAAIPAARRVVELRPDYSRGQFTLADLLTQQIEKALPDSDAPFEEAAAAYDAALALTTIEKQPAALFGRARLHSLWPGHDDDARESFVALLDHADANPGAARRIAREVSGFARRTEDAALLERALRLAVANEPMAAERWLELAQLKSGENGDPLPFLDAAISNDGENPELQVARAQWLASNDDLDSAADGLVAAADSGIAPDRLLEVAVQLRLGARQVPAAVELAKRLDSEWPASRGAAISGARIGLALGRPEEGREALEAYVAREEDVVALELLALSYYKSGRNRRAASRTIERAEVVDPVFDGDRARWAARLHHAAADPEGVLAALRRLESHRLALTEDEMLYRAHALYLLGRTVPADALLDAIVDLDDPPHKAIVEFAARRIASQPERVGELLASARAARPKLDVLLAADVRVELAQGRAEQALQKLEAFLEEGGSLSLKVVASRAAIYTALDRLEEAERDRMAVLKLSGSDPESTRRLADLYRRMGRLDELAMSFDAAATSGALGLSGRVFAARFRMELGDYQAAIEALEPLFELAGENAGPRMRVDMARSLAELNRDLPRATRLAQQGLAMLGPDAEAHAALGLVHLRLGRTDRAANMFYRSIDLDRAQGIGSPGTLVHYGEALRELGRTAEARLAFEQALAIDATHVTAQTALDQIAAAPRAD